MISLSSVFWREAWKYGERALRYCNHDAGHALAAVAVAAAALGWDARLLDGLSHADLEALIGVPQTYPPPPVQLPDGPVRGKLPWIEPSTGLRSPYLPRRDEPCCGLLRPTERADFAELYKDFTVREVVRKRRSAVDMDRVHVMERNTFYQILLHCLPSGELGHGEEGEEIKKQGKQCALPFRVLTWDAEVHAALFVHRVAGLPKGLYFLVRNEDHFDALKCAMRPEFEWERPDGCPDGLPLYRLARGDCQELAKQLSCHQDIASDGCFSLGMVARFEPVLRKRVLDVSALVLETGALSIHEVLGIKDMEFQSLYHFTVGGPMVDKRIMSLPAYPGPGIDA
ncbi:hypothetical protein ACMD2_09314 [Ananas comosus]|uniref:Nitroreductase domain-containing protein n=1 Tax=Ananas comosus TaxID=4615 RepID=A0A199VC51_ANACO|nr:hypothetical protein ACMD2_09314 [Ananas comosus]